MMEKRNIYFDEFALRLLSALKTVANLDSLTVTLGAIFWHQRILHFHWMRIEKKFYSWEWTWLEMKFIQLIGINCKLKCYSISKRKNSEQRKWIGMRYHDYDVDALR